MSESFLVRSGPPPAPSWFVVDEENDILADENGSLIVWLDPAPTVFVWPGRLR